MTNITRLNMELAHLYPILSDSYADIISKLAQSANRILFIANDDEKLEFIATQLEIFAPDKQVIIFPSWDCSIYDKISPNISNLNRRINALDLMSSAELKNVILLTSLNAIAQFLLPKTIISDYTQQLAINDSIKQDNLVLLLEQLSFRRVEIASEPGDFAIRDDIIDLVANVDEGWRIDFDGDRIKNIRLFDLITQISSASLNQIKILPSSEVILNTKTIENFCDNFQKLFGIQAIEHPLYEAIAQGRKYPGMEHYLPLFYHELSDLFDYFSPDLLIYNSDLQVELDKLEQSIHNSYITRKDLLSHRFQDEVIHYPIKPESMWLSKECLLNKLSKIKTAIFYNSEVSDGINLSIKRVANFDILAQTQSISAFDLFKKCRDNNKSKYIIACNSEGSAQRIKNILENYNIHWYAIKYFDEYRNLSGKTVAVIVLSMEHGYSFEDYTIVTEQDLLGEKIIRKKTTKTIESLMEQINGIQIGEYVVHKQHGIGLFSGLEMITAAGINHDCMKIIYDDGDILYIPVENLDLLTRYGSNSETIRLDRLGGISWNNRKTKLKDKLKEIAAELIKIAAVRTNQAGQILAPISGSYEEFCRKFPYAETDDQLDSINDVMQDLASGTPMDRLICGDVGFGKTEIAMRAAFIATHPETNHKQQVVVIVPTTLLARQHYHGFIKRFADFSVQIRQLSRLVSAKDMKAIKAAVKAGEIDIVIGTHALLSQDIEFKNLGLVIVDEEQRFGVAQKEKLKQLQNNVHILTLSATPIPRTLQMSLTGVKDLSIIATPPVDRQVVKTYVMAYDSVVLREAILREFYRGGQVFFVCPRISDINEILPKLRELVPEIKIVIAHGQMAPAALEEIMSDFYNKKFDLLLSTSIVESGIDIAEANTIIIHRADKFGLSALYQLRGRVGRSNIKAFAYLLLPNKNLSKLATTRLEVMQTLDTLGAGFTVASHDMDIRGFGNLVGDEQSGHIREVGLELYQEMLQEAIFALKHPEQNSEFIIEEEYSPQINLGLPVMLPDEYIADLNLRLSLYRSLAGFKTIEEVEHFAVEMIDRFGKYPVEVEYLLKVIKMKLKAKKINIDKIDVGPKAFTFSFKDHRCLHPQELIEFIAKNQTFIKLKPDQKLLINKEFNDINSKLNFIDGLLDKLAF